MKGFLQEVAENILSDYQDLRNLEIIVPNRRTGLFLKKAIADTAGRTCWMPTITTIQDVFLSNSEIHSAEDLLLIYRLYNIFIRHTKSTESFDDFYYWGEMILSDFDDIDKYLVDASKLFLTIRDLKEIDKNFDGYDEEELEIIRRFWTNVSQADLSIHKQKFLDLWDKMSAIYCDFTNELLNDKIAYTGLIYRDVAARVNDCKFAKSDYAVVGFNALNKCEKAMLSHLKLTKKTRFYWDADKYYVNNEYQEAGRFLRDNIRRFGAYNNIGIVDYIKPIKKDIEVIMAPSPVSQVKMIAEILDKWKAELDFNPEKTAIVLGDENLLIPLMYSIPPYMEPYNVSMGFPVKNSASFGFLSHLVNLRRRERKNRDIVTFYFKDVISLINHILIKDLFPDDSKKLDLLIKKDKLIYIDSEILSINPIFCKLFSPEIKNVFELSNWFNSLCADLLIEISANDDFAVESEYLSKIANRVLVLKDCITNDKIEIERNEIFFKLLMNAVRSLSAAFEGEPLTGMQVLGFLETRCLDFDRVIMLSINEGVFPKKSAAQSLIPYNLRRFYELPSIEFQDSIFAYYFYRLLQRSKEIKIIYSAQAGDTSSEASRFISQIKYELGQEIKYRNDGYKISLSAYKPSFAVKNENVITKIKEQFVKGISPKAINEFLNCEFRYYLNYVESIKEPDKLEEEEDGAFFGKLFHQIMFYLYEPYIGKKLDKADFDKISDKKNLEDAKQRAVVEIFSLKSEPEMERYSAKLIVDVVMKYIVSLLDYDKKQSPFSIVSLEKRYEYAYQSEKNELPQVKITGIIDRVDLVDGTYRIIDYKTGKTELSVALVDDLFKEERDQKYSTITQLLLYSLMLSDNASEVLPAVYNINSLNEEYDYHLNIGKQNITDFNTNTKQIFHEKMDEMFLKLLNIDSYFQQTLKIENCNFCPYAVICDRK